MKKVLLVVAVIALCLSLLSACGQEEEPFRVVCVKEVGIIIETDLGHVYVKNVSADFEIDELDTVYMVFSENDLKAESGTFIDYFGDERSYSYVLKTVESIRLPSEGEPTYG